MVLSFELRDMARDATIGLTDAEVVNATGLGFPTWRKWMAGILPSRQAILKFCAGLNLDASAYLQARDRVSDKTTADAEILRTALEVMSLTAESRYEIMGVYREVAKKQAKKRSKSRAA